MVEIRAAADTEDTEVMSSVLQVELRTVYYNSKLEMMSIFHKNVMKFSWMKHLDCKDLMTFSLLPCSAQTLRF